jgi:hypothetical protein
MQVTTTPRDRGLALIILGPAALAPVLGLSAAACSQCRDAASTPYTVSIGAGDAANASDGGDAGSASEASCAELCGGAATVEVDCELDGSVAICVNRGRVCN